MAPVFDQDRATRIGEAAYDAVIESLERDARAYDIEEDGFPQIGADGILCFEKSHSLNIFKVAIDVRDAVHAAAAKAIAESI